MTMTHSRTDELFTAWLTDPQHDTRQLMHAVNHGRTVAYCGVQVTVVGEPWPLPGTSTPLSRYSTCTHVVHQLWSHNP